MILKVLNKQLLRIFANVSNMFRLKIDDYFKPIYGM